jgi:hypothetical protein
VPALGTILPEGVLTDPDNTLLISSSWVSYIDELGFANNREPSVIDDEERKRWEW